jgi:hypothetical protein
MRTHHRPGQQAPLQKPPDGLGPARKPPLGFIGVVRVGLMGVWGFPTCRQVEAVEDDSLSCRGNTMAISLKRIQSF